MRNAVITVMFLIHIFALGTALGMNVPIRQLVPAALGLLFIVIGNVLPRVRPNWMMGIRTPWTLSSDRVWERTHRVGYLMTGLGVLLVLAAALAPAAATLILIVVGVVIVSFGTIIYSYLAWREEKRA